MKKLWVLTALLLVFGIGFASAQIWENTAPANFRIQIQKNQYSPGYQWTSNTGTARFIFNGNQLMAGQRYELEITFTSNRAIPELKFMLVDGSQAANWWKELSIQNSGDDWPTVAVQANTPVSATIPFTIYHNASAATGGVANAANLLVLDYDQPNAVATLTFSKFIFRRLQ
jgi:hypothetical protein